MSAPPIPPESQDFSVPPSANELRWGPQGHDWFFTGFGLAVLVVVLLVVLAMWLTKDDRRENARRQRGHSALCAAAWQEQHTATDSVHLLSHCPLP